MKENKFVLITGASRGIGKAFLDAYKQQPNTVTIGINRTGSAGVNLDLTDANKSFAFAKELNLSNINRVVYMHAIGIDKFEPDANPHIDKDGDGIDDEVMSSNYTTFVNLADPLVERLMKEKIPTTVCNIGSVSDIFEVPFWKSFTKTKNKVRRYAKSSSSPTLKNIVLNVSTTLDEDGRKYGRVNADPKYWQTTNELVGKAFNTLDNFQFEGANYAEFDYFKPNPHYRRDYFTNLPELYAIWQRDLGFQGAEIPHGIRI